MIAVNFALAARKTNRTDALVSVNSVAALATVEAWLGGALVDVDLAVLASVASRAGAVIVVDQIDAQRVVLTLTDAVVDVARAVLAGETAATLAPVDREDVLKTSVIFHPRV